MSCIWIIDPYSEIPKPGWRDGRYFLAGKVLSEQGYKVFLFISDYSHKEKKVVPEKGQLEINSNFNIVVVPTTAYQRHISLKRIRYEQNFAKAISQNSWKIPMPQIIILKEPAIFMFENLKHFIKTSGAKLVLDIIDLWPELFELKFPAKLRWLGKLIFRNFYKKREKIFKAASAMTAVAPDYLQVGLNVNPGVPGEVVYWGCNTSSIQVQLNAAKPALLSGLKLPEKGSHIWGIYAGTLGESYDITTLLKAAKKMQRDFPDLKFLIAGAGPSHEKVQEAASSGSNIFYLGSIPTNQLYQLFSFCDFGFSTYADGSTVSMPIKCYDYLAAGLPLVNSLKRNLGTFLDENMLGYQYEASNADHLVTVLTDLISDKAKLEAMKLRCKAISIQFDDYIQYSKFVPLINGLIDLQQTAKGFQSTI